MILNPHTQLTSTDARNTLKSALNIKAMPENVHSKQTFFIIKVNEIAVIFKTKPVLMSNLIFLDNYSRRTFLQSMILIHFNHLFFIKLKDALMHIQKHQAYKSLFQSAML